MSFNEQSPAEIDHHREVSDGSEQQPVSYLPNFGHVSGTVNAASCLSLRRREKAGIDGAGQTRKRTLHLRSCEHLHLNVIVKETPPVKVLFHPLERIDVHGFVAFLTAEPSNSGCVLQAAGCCCSLAVQQQHQQQGPEP